MATWQDALEHIKENIAKGRKDLDLDTEEEFFDAVDEVIMEWGNKLDEKDDDAEDED